MLISTLTGLFIGYSMLEGVFQAHYYDLIPSNHSNHRNLHPYYMLARACVSALIWIALFEISDAILASVYIVCLACIFSFFHNGVYYYTRNFLNPELYKKKWWDHSETSKALIELGTGFRTALAIIGFIGIVFVYIEFKTY